MSRPRALLGSVAVAFLLVGACGGGSEERAGRTETVVMLDIAFAPDRLDVKQGETVEFLFRNSGQAEHEAVIGDEKLQESQEDGGMSGHAGGHQGSEDVPRVVLSPGRTGKLTYTFDQPGELFIGCHVPGHWKAGMKIPIMVR